MKFMLKSAIPGSGKRAVHPLLLKFSLPDTGCLAYNKNIYVYIHTEVVDIMMQLYDREEIMRVHDFNVARDAGIMNVVRALKDVGLSFSEIVEKIKVQFSLSPERAKEEVEEYWES